MLCFFVCFTSVYVSAWAQGGPKTHTNKSQCNQNVRSLVYSSIGLFYIDFEKMDFQGDKSTNTAKWQKGFWSVPVRVLASIWRSRSATESPNAEIKIPRTLLYTYKVKSTPKKRSQKADCKGGGSTLTVSLTVKCLGFLPPPGQACYNISCRLINF